MSEAALHDRTVKQRWAVPGSSHDRLVRFAKVALPSAVGVLVAFLAVAPLERDSEGSFILDKNQVENAPERMRAETARYVGEDNEGRKFEILARTAVQRSSDEPIVDISGMVARLSMPQGPLTIVAEKARYDLDEQLVRVNGPVRVAGPEGYRLLTSGVTVDLKSRQVRSGGGVSGAMRLGEFSARQLRADLGERNVVLEGRARLKITQGAVR